MRALRPLLMSLALFAVAGVPILAQSGSFGNAVLVGDDELIIAEPNPTFRAGALYIYRKVGNTWQEAAQIHAPATKRADGFGTVLAATGNTLIVGQRGGPLHTYERDGQRWRHTGTVSGDGVNGTDPGCGEYGYCGTEFGIELATHGNQGVVFIGLFLGRREAILVDAGKQGFGPAMTQEEINTLIVRHAQDGHHVVRLKSGDPGVFGRLDEELDACDAAGIEWQIVPGLTSAAAAAAGIGQGLTRRGRNSAVRLLTGHDVKGFAEHDWRALARPGEVAALYMAKRGARFLQGRLLMHGAAPETPVTIVENASRPDEQVIATTLAALPATLESGDVAGPAILLYGLAPRARATAAAPAVGRLPRRQAAPPPSASCQPEHFPRHGEGHFPGDSGRGWRRRRGQCPT